MQQCVVHPRHPCAPMRSCQSSDFREEEGQASSGHSREFQTRIGAVRVTFEEVLRIPASVLEFARLPPLRKTGILSERRAMIQGDATNSKIFIIHGRSAGLSIIMVTYT